MADYFDEMGWEPLGAGQTPDHLLHLARLLRDFGMWEELGHGHKLPPCASKASIANLLEKDITVSENEPSGRTNNILPEFGKGEQCPVCLKEYTVGETVKMMPCKHSFHSSCILPWLERTNSCPLCRHELPTDDEEYEMYKKEKLRAKQREEELKTLHNSMFS